MYARKSRGSILTRLPMRTAASSPALIRRSTVRRLTSRNSQASSRLFSFSTIGGGAVGLGGCGKGMAALCMSHLGGRGQLAFGDEHSPDLGQIIDRDRPHAADERAAVAIKLAEPKQVAEILGSHAKLISGLRQRNKCGYGHSDSFCEWAVTARWPR